MKYFLTVDWCNQGKRGIFCDKRGKGFWNDNVPHENEKMQEILGMFFVILHPKSEPFLEKDVKKYSYFRPLGEYSNQYGIALKREDIMITPCRMIGDRCITHGHDAPCPDRKVLTVEEWESYRSLGLIDTPGAGDVCYICEGTVRIINCVNEGWEIRCAGCDFLWGED